MVDPRPETVDGETKIVMTPQMIHDIFDEYPVIAKAHRENVPSKVGLLFFRFSELLSSECVVDGIRVLDALFQVEALPCPPRFYSVDCCAARRPG